MAAEDLPSVSDLESRSPSAWQQSLILAELGRQNSIQLVAGLNNMVIGWCCSRFVGPEAELLKISVQVESRRQKISTRLLVCLEKHLGESGVQVLFLEVRSGNESAISFYHKVGFTEVARRIKYYSLPEDDALLFRKVLMGKSIKREHR